MTFASLRLAEPILRAVEAEGYSVPTPIQIQAIPHVLDGRDLLGCAQTGTGKTAAFALPILHRLSQTEPQAVRRIRVLVLAPTRELAAQIGDSFRVYGKNTGLRQAVIFGGVSQFHQEKALRQGVDILVATPGRLIDLMGQGFVHLQNVEVVVLDEADRMLDMGFIHDIRRIAQKLPQKRQTLLFSATMPDEIRKFAASLLHQPAEVSVAAISSAAETVQQFVCFVAKGDKPLLLSKLLQTSHMPRTLVFTRTKHGADKLVKKLRTAGLRAEAIHGNKAQNARQKALASFKSANPPVLVATDIASRGIDVDNISHVINYDIPNEPETYVHRIGRTGRAGASGMAVSLCDAEERHDLRAIERLIRQPIPVGHEMQDTELPEKAPAAKVTHEKATPAPAPRGKGPAVHVGVGVRPAPSSNPAAKPVRQGHGQSQSHGQGQGQGSAKRHKPADRDQRAAAPARAVASGRPHRSDGPGPAPHPLNTSRPKFRRAKTKSRRAV